MHSISHSHYYLRGSCLTVWKKPNFCSLLFVKCSAELWKHMFIFSLSHYFSLFDFIWQFSSTSAPSQHKFSTILMNNACCFEHCIHVVETGQFPALYLVVSANGKTLWNWLSSPTLLSHIYLHWRDSPSATHFSQDTSFSVFVFLLRAVRPLLTAVILLKTTKKKNQFLYNRPS